MKRLALFFLIQLTVVMCLRAQQSVDKIFVLGSSTNDENLMQIESRLHNNPNVFRVMDEGQNAIEKITSFLELTKCNELHLYVPCTNEAIFLNEFVLNKVTMDLFSASLAKWKDLVAEKIVIHNYELARNEVRPAYVEKLMILTGLSVEIAQTY